MAVVARGAIQPEDLSLRFSHLEGDHQSRPCHAKTAAAAATIALRDLLDDGKSSDACDQRYPNSSSNNVACAHSWRIVHYHLHLLFGVTSIRIQALMTALVAMTLS